MTETELTPVDEIIDTGTEALSLEASGDVDENGIVTLTTTLGSASITVKYDQEERGLIANTGMTAIDVLIMGLPQAVSQILDALAVEAERSNA